MPVEVTSGGSGYGDGGFGASIFGSGQLAGLGNISPGWSVQEFATPTRATERAGGTGVVSFGGKSKEQSILLAENSSTVKADGLGSVSGTIRNVSVSGLSASLTQDNQLARFDAARSIPSMMAGSVPGALDLADQLTGTTRLVAPDGYFWSLAGHLVAFDSSGARAPYQVESRQYIDYSAGQQEPFPYRVDTYRGAVYSNSFTSVGDKIYANGLRGETFFFGKPTNVIAGAYNKPVNRVRLKTALNGADFTFSYQGGPDYAENPPAYVGGAVGSATIDYSAATLILEGSYQSPNVFDERLDFSSSVSLAALDLDEELAVFIDFGFYQLSDPIPADNTYVFSVRVCNTSDFSTVVESSEHYSTGYPDDFYFPWTVQGNVRSLHTRQDEDRSIDVPADWEVAPAFSWDGTLSLGEPSVGVESNVWGWLQDACVAYRWEILVLDDEVVARPLGGRSLETVNVGPGSTLTSSANLTGRQVDVAYQNCAPVDNSLVYDAREDDNRIITVEPGQSTVVTVATSTYLTAVVSPTRTTTFVPGENTYYVVDSTGLPIAEDQWEDFGGDVAVTIDPEVVGGAVVTVTGPEREIPSTTGPYSLAVSDGENQYAALSFFGSGVSSDPKTLELLTGADPEKTPTLVATAVDNPFVSSLGQAFDLGVWASDPVSGPENALSLTLPVGVLKNPGPVSGFGSAPGSVLDYGPASYRVQSSTVRNLDCILQCEQYVTAESFDQFWSGATVGDHDSAWSGYSLGDQKSLPYLVR